MNITQKLTAAAMSAILACGMCPAIALADSTYTAVGSAELSAQATPEAIPYSGTQLHMVKSDLVSEFGMLSDKTNSMTVSIEDDEVQVAYTPSNLTVYSGFYLDADCTDKTTWDSEKFVAAEEDGTYDFTIPKSYCGKAWPIAPVKVKDGESTSEQYYLAVPSEAAIGIDYEGETVALVKNDLVSTFGMLSDKTDSMQLSVENGMVHVAYTPSNTTVYSGFYVNALCDDETTWNESNFISATSEGTYDYTISTQYCGKAWPIAPKKVKDGKSTSEQYYLAVPSIDKLPADYTAVDAAIASAPSKLSGYTKASAKALTDAIAAVDRTKKGEEQDAVDAMAKAIEDAVKGLKAKGIAVGKTAKNVAAGTGVTVNVKATSASAVTVTKGTVKSGGSATVNKVTVNEKSYNVTAIGAKAFENTKAASVTIGANVKTIGKNAFKGASKLKTITVKSSKLDQASCKALVQNTKVTKVKLSGVSKSAAKNYKKWFPAKVNGKKLTVK